MKKWHSGASELTNFFVHVQGSISDKVASLLEGRFDTSALFTGISRVESGLAEIEGGIRGVHDAVKKPAATPTTQNGPAE